MRACFRAVLVALTLSTAIAAAAAPQTPARVPLDVVLDRAASYLGHFVDEFENVVAEERSIQDSSVLLPSFSPIAGGRGAAAAMPSLAEALRSRHRDLRSDFLLVKSPDTEALVPFRDVIEVDGVAVHDREARLARLFLNATDSGAMEQAEKIREEGARYNLGNMRSTLGNPVLALGVLQRSYQHRFHFSLMKEDKSYGAAVSVVEYKEVVTPAMVRGEAGRDLMAHGRLWIEHATGRVVKTELRVEQPAIRAAITTTFQPEERSSIAVPLEMREQYTLGNGNRVTTVATYGHFRRFDVSATEDIRAPIITVVDRWTGMTLVEIPPGRFTMGSAASEAGRNDDESLHDVEITRPFLMGQYEVTQQEWRTVMGTSPSRFKDCGARCPVENVSFVDVQQFLTKLSARAALATSATPLRYRLPTEAEWEYACRAHTTGPFSTGENLTTAQGNYNGKQPYGTFPAGDFRQKPTPVGLFPPNPWGLADMHGNVWEWTSDWYGPYGETAAANIDPHGPSSGETRVIRGGSWYFDANSARCALRYTHAAQDRGFSLGFRVAADRVP